MSFLDEVKNLKDCARRLEQYYYDSQGEIVRLRRKLGQAKEEIGKARKRREPGSRKIAEDCKACFFRVEFLKRAGTEGEGQQ